MTFVIVINTYSLRVKLFANFIRKKITETPTSNTHVSLSPILLIILVFITISLNNILHLSFHDILVLLLFSCSVMSNSLRPRGLQHARLPCSSLSPGACSHSFPLVDDAIQPSHPLLCPSPPAFRLSQHQGLFQWVGSSHQVAKVLELQLQHQSFQWIFRTYFP